MSPLNKKDVIQALKLEMSIIEGGGYGRSVRTPWRETKLFRDSVTCLNVGEAEKKHPCGECFLIEHVPDSCRETEIPCHHIQLNKDGDTIEDLDRQGRRDEAERLLLEWIKSTIKRLEED
jgi:hypothetical protein